MANFTTTMVSFDEEAGSNIALNKPSVTLLIIPADGYVVNSSNFSTITPLASQLNSVTFSQSGNNVRAVATFKNPTTMPSYDLNVPICIRGFAESAVYSIAGTINNSLCNTSGAPITSYSGTGSYKEILGVTEIPVRAINGYYFPTQPTLVISSGDSNNYAVSYSNTLDDKGNIISVDFVVNYTFPSKDVSGDVLKLTACAQQIYSPSVKITGYSTPLNNVLSTGETRLCTIYGVEGANFSLTYKNSANVVINTFSGTIDSTGSYKINIIYPPASSDQVYTFTLTGDLASSFNTPSGQPSVWTVAQNTQTTTTTTTAPPGPFAQTMILFGVDNSSTACGNIVAGVEFALRTTRYSAKSFIEAGDTVYNGPGLTNPTTSVVPVYYGYFVSGTVIAAWVYVGTDGVVLASGYCS